LRRLVRIPKPKKISARRQSPEQARNWPRHSNGRGAGDDNGFFNNPATFRFSLPRHERCQNLPCGIRDDIALPRVALRKRMHKVLRLL
jgi:hypothetical protein